MNSVTLHVQISVVKQYTLEYNLSDENCEWSWNQVNIARLGALEREVEVFERTDRNRQGNE